MIPKIETKQLILRAFQLTDAKDVQRLAGNYELYKTTLHIPHPYEDGFAESWIELHEADFTERSFLTLAIVQKSDNQLVGCVSFGMSLKRQLGEIGYWIGQEYWGKGYGTQASRVVMDYAFANMNANKIIGRHFAGNPASGKIMKNCGMTMEGLLRQDQVKDGEFHDICYYGILKSEWEGQI